jgi:hypothetical protein
MIANLRIPLGERLEYGLQQQHAARSHGLQFAAFILPTPEAVQLNFTFRPLVGVVCGPCNHLKWLAPA